MAFNPMGPDATTSAPAPTVGGIQGSGTGDSPPTGRGNYGGGGSSSGSGSYGGVSNAAPTGETGEGLGGPGPK